MALSPQAASASSQFSPTKLGSSLRSVDDKGNIYISDIYYILYIVCTCVQLIVLFEY